MCFYFPFFFGILDVFTLNEAPDEFHQYSKLQNYLNSILKLFFDTFKYIFKVH